MTILIQKQFPNTKKREDAASCHSQKPCNVNHHGQEPAAVSEEDREKQNALGTEPQFSLAGPNTTMRSIYPSQNIYEDPEYRNLNPQYGKSQDEPLWSLAQPLPRVVRPGMSLGQEDGKKKGINCNRYCKKFNKIFSNHFSRK